MLIKKLYLFFLFCLLGVSVNAKVDSVLISTSLNNICNDSCKGWAIVEVYSATSTGPFRIIWKGNTLPGQTVTNDVPFSDTLQNLCAGDFSVEVVDLSDASKEFPIYFTIQNASILSPQYVINVPTCFDSSNGQIAILNVDNGTGPFHYKWSTGPNDTLNLLTGLNQGTYSLNIRDNNSCTVNRSFFVPAPDKISPNIGFTDVTCKGKCDGTAFVQPTGGTAPFSLLWSNSDTNPLLTNLCPGKFVATVTDFNGCISKDSILVAEPDSLKSTYAINDPSCSSVCNGLVTSVATGGRRPYSYHWSGYLDNDSVLNNVCDGNITATVTDASGCYFVSNITLSEPVALSVQPVLNTSSCGLCDGDISATVSGGSGPYKYLWIGQQARDTFNFIDSICAGIYRLAVSDAVSCSDTFSFALSDDTSGIKDIVFTSVESSCADVCNGSILARTISGTGPFTYLWTPGSQTDSVITGVCSGSYNLVVTDASGCKRFEITELESESDMVVTSTSVFNGCNGDCGGEIYLQVSQGISPYTFFWAGLPVTASSAGNLCPGNYPFKVTDANGCKLRDTATLTQPDSISVSINITAESCYNKCDGKANVVLSGGSAPYTIGWDNAETGLSVSGLCSGQHWVEIQDAAGCIKRKYFTLVSPAKIQLNPVLYHPDCGVNNGAVKLNPTGGAGPYSYSWFGSGVSFNAGDSASGLTVGQLYSAEIEDANGCSAQDTFPLQNPNGPEFTFTTTDESCANKCDGSITLLPGAVTGNIIYNWYSPLGGSGAFQMNTIGGICPGNYFAGITVNNCQTIKTIKIKKAPTINISIDINHPTCSSACDGSLSANISGGVPPFTMNWSNGSPFSTISALCAGSYVLTVTDANGCSVQSSALLENPAEISISLSTSNLLCYDVCDGKINALVTGGNGPYSYLWSNSGTGSTAENLCPGDYWLKVTDANGCSGIENISIGNGIPITASFNKTNAGCGQNNGSVSILPSAGNGLPYSFLWSTGDTLSTVNNLTAGLYQVDVKDNSGCSQNFTVTLGNTGGPVLTDSLRSTSCYGLCDGAAFAKASGSSSPYFYQWINSVMQTGDSAYNLCSGVIYYSATDALGCISYDSVFVTEPEKINVTFSISPISCPGASDGSLNVIGTGGQGPLSYLWSNADVTSITDSLIQGLYSVMVTDSTGCTAKDTVELNDPSSLSINFTVENSSCFGGCDGQVAATIVGGNGPYTYSWNDALNQTTPIATGLCAGYVRLTITDGNNCTSVDSALITSPTGISAIPALTNPTCNGGTNGSISLVVTGGSGPYNAVWNNGKNGLNISGLNAGTHSVTITDSKNCIYQNSYILNNPTQLTVNLNVTKPSCGNNNGSVAAVVSGGSGSYSFMWNTIPTKTTSTASTLWAGIYEVTVTDNISGCTRSKEVIVGNSGAQSLSFSVNDESCRGNCDGNAIVHVGSGKQYFLWNDPLAQTDSLVTFLCPGIYAVMVTDSATKCISIDTTSISTSDLSVRILNSKAVECNGDCNGSAGIEATGGYPLYTYSWNTVPSQSGQTATNLCSGSYTATATDTSGCSASTIIRINEPDSISIDLNIVQNALCENSCNGRANILVSGGSMPYTILWNGKAGGFSSTDLCPGTNVVEVTDASGCSKNLSFEIGNALPISDNAIVILPSCGAYNGSITLNPGGGKGPYFYSWSDGSQTSFISGLFAGVYAVDITDANGCTKSFNYFINNPNAPALSFDKNTVKCYGDCNGTARVSPVGGVGPYDYLWNYVPASSLDSLTGLCAGVYFVKVTDATSCIAFGADTITEPALLTGNLSKIKDGCGGLCEGEAVVVPAGGTGIYNYVWNSTPPQSTATATSLCAGTYVVVVTDANNCLYTDSLTIVPPPALVIDSMVIENASCFTNADGEVTVFYQGGTAPITFLWSDSQTSQVAIGLKNGIISVVVSDTNGCNAFDTAIVGVEDTVLVDAFVDTVVCIGSQILLQGKGQGVTIYQWFADSSGNLTLIGSGDSIFYIIEDTTTILLRGENSVTPPCFDNDTAYVIGIPPPVLVASATSSVIEEGNTTGLLASPYLFNGFYAWTPASTLNDSASIAPIATPGETTTYFVTGTDEFGCSGTDSITIAVIEDNEIINGFSPNGDGVNDTWEIPSIKDYPDVIVEVYNRWGTQVFRSEGYKKPWDGKYEGETLPASSYYFVIDYFGDGKKVESGAVTILF